MCAVSSLHHGFLWLHALRWTMHAEGQWLWYGCHPLPTGCLWPLTHQCLTNKVTSPVRYTYTPISLAAPAPSHGKEGSGLLWITELCRITKNWYNPSEHSMCNQQIFVAVTSKEWFKLQHNSKRNIKVGGLRVKRRLILFWERLFTLVGTWEIQNTVLFPVRKKRASIL